MKKTNLLISLCLSYCMGFAQSIPTPLPGGAVSGTSGGGKYSGPLPPHAPGTPFISTIVGNGTAGYAGNGGQATAAELYDPTGVVFDTHGNLYIADQVNNCIRKVTTAGIISNFAGNGYDAATGLGGYSGDGGQATAAELDWPTGICFDTHGNLYIADNQNMVIRKVNTSGIISTIAGLGPTHGGFSGDGGQATAAEIAEPTGVAFDASGNLYICDQYNLRIRKINTSGVINTIAGSGTAGYSGDGGQATAAEINYPFGIAFDATGNLYIGDESNSVVRMVNTSGVISTFAGTGTGGYSGDGAAATSAELYHPTGVAVYSGVLYIADRDNSVIRYVTSGTIWTLAGDGTDGYSGDCGVAGSAELGAPVGITMDANGNICIAEAGNLRIRKLWSTYQADAGSNQIDQQNDCGGWPGVTLGTTGNTGIGGLTYAWSPHTGSALSCTNCAEPTSAWSNTTTAEVYTLSVTVEGCTATTSTVQVSAVGCGSGCTYGCRTMDITSLNQTTSTFAVYPNPSNTQITLSLYDKTEYIQIIDMQGRLVYQTKDIDAGEFKLDITNYNKGIYFVMAKIGNTLEKQKLIVE